MAPVRKQRKQIPLRITVLKRLHKKRIQKLAKLEKGSQTDWRDLLQQSLRDKLVCKICLQDPVTHTVYPCGHTVCKV